MAARFEVKLLAGRVRIDLYGILDGPTAQELEQEVRRVCDPLPPRSLEVLINLRGATTCALEARPVLAGMQKALASRARRIAYVDDRPYMRGMALWVMHLAGDGNAKAVPTEAQAEEWLQDGGGREASAGQHTAAA